MKCFQVGYMEMFPTATEAKPKVIRTVETTEEVPIFCACSRASDFPRSRKSRGIRGIADLKRNLENSNNKKKKKKFFFFFLMSVAHGF